MIEANDSLKVLMRAEDIPDKSSIKKPKGEKPYVLRHSLQVYSGKNGEAPLVVEGLFLVDEVGTINQVHPGKTLCWVVNALWFKEYLDECLFPEEDK